MCIGKRYHISWHQHRGFHTVPARSAQLHEQFRNPLTDFPENCSVARIFCQSPSPGLSALSHPSPAIPGQLMANAALLSFALQISAHASMAAACRAYCAIKDGWYSSRLAYLFNFCLSLYYPVQRQNEQNTCNDHQHGHKKHSRVPCPPRFRGSIHKTAFA